MLAEINCCIIRWKINYFHSFLHLSVCTPCFFSTTRDLNFLFCQEVISIKWKLIVEAAIWKQTLSKIKFFLHYPTYITNSPHLKIWKWSVHIYSSIRGINREEEIKTIHLKKKKSDCSNMSILTCPR